MELLETRTLLAAFTPGNLLIYRLGDGSPLAISNVATAVFLDEVTPTGTLVQSLALPTSDSSPNQILTGSPLGQGEGLMTSSDDGQYAFFTGYDAAPGTGNLTNSPSTVIRRVVGRVDASGTIDTSTTISDGYSGGTIRSAASPDGTNLWVSGSGGATGGIRYTIFGSSGPSTQISTAQTNTRGVGTSGGQLYVAAVSGPLRIGKVGTGTPTTAGQTITALPGIPVPAIPASLGNDPQQFFFADLSPSVPGVDTVYIADSTAGVCKFSFIGSTWVATGVAQAFGQGVLALAGRVDGDTTTLYVLTRTTNPSTDNELRTITDTSGYGGVLVGPLQPTSYAAGANRVARGITFVPVAAMNPADPDPHLAGTSGDDEFVLRRVADNLVLTLGTTTLLDQPADETRSLTIDGLAGNDRLTIDYSGGDPLPNDGAAFHGGSQTTLLGDRLSILGTGSQAATYRPNGAANPALDNDGTISIDGKPVTFTGLEPLDLISMAVANIVLPGADDTLRLASGLTSSGQAAVVASGTSQGVPFESVALRNNALVNIDTTFVDGNDAVTIGGASGTHGNASLHLITGAGADEIAVTGAATFSGDVSLTTQKITFSTPAAIMTAAGPVTLAVGAGSIEDDSPAVPSVIAPTLTATAGSGILLGTNVANLSAETGAGDINITQAGAVAIGNLAAASGSIALAASSAITIQNDVTGLGDVTLVAGDSAAANVDQLVLVPGVFVRSLSGNVTLSAGDDLTIAAGSMVQAAGAVSLNVDEGDVDASGSSLTILGSVASGVGAILTGGNDNDVFTLSAQSTSSLQIDGEDPFAVSVGDTLNLDIVGAVSPNLVLGGIGEGTWSFANRQGVSYQNIETVNIVSGPAAGDLVVDMKLAGFQDGVDDDIFVRLDPAGTELLIDVNGVSLFRGAQAGVRSLTVIGSADNDRLQIDEVNGRLPRFSGGTPIVDHIAIGGGAANASHLNSAADQWLETLHFTDAPWGASDVPVHFDGGAGADVLDLSLTSGHIVHASSDTLDAGNSGNLVAAGVLGPNLLLSFANLGPLNLSGPGSVLVVDASSTPGTSSIVLSDDAAPGDGWSQIAGDGGFETTRLRGFTQLIVLGGNGSESIDQFGLDSATSLGSVTIAGGNTSDFFGLPGGDDAGDTLRVGSTPATTVVQVRGHGGDDLIELFDAGFTVDHLAASVTISGDAGNNALVIDDHGDLSLDFLHIDENSIDGNTSAAGADLFFSNIDTLSVTATAAGDTVDASIAPGSDLDFVTLSGWTGGDQFLLTTSDEQIGGLPSGLQSIGLFGDAPGNPNLDDGSDLFGQSPASPLPGTPAGLAVRMIRPSVSTAITIDGGRPSAAWPPVGDQPGDALSLDVSALASVVLVATLGGSAGQPGIARSLAPAPSHRPLAFAQIEDLNLADRGILSGAAMGDLFVRGSDALDNVSLAAAGGANLARVRIGSFQDYFTIGGRAIVYALGGNDYVQMGNFNHPAEFYGGDGDDYLTGYQQADKLVGGAGRDRINAMGGDNVVWGDEDPVEVGLPDTEANRQLLATMGPGRFAESLYGDILSTLEGSDTVYGGPGADQITTAGGSDWVHGGQGIDPISGGAGDDRLFGGEGNDNLNGGEGQDVLDGGAGSDTLNAGGGHDVLIGGTGDDTLGGDAGRDLVLDGAADYGSQPSESRSAGNASDLAMQALLADWLADFAVSGPLATDHAGRDKLRGGTGEADTLSTDDPAELLDFESLLDALLP